MNLKGFDKYGYCYKNSHYDKLFCWKFVPYCIYCIPYFNYSSVAFGIYAGTVNPKCKDGTQTWKNKSEVTDEAIEAVKTYMKMQANLNKSNYYSFTWKDEKGKETVLSLEIKE